ncbi:MAG: uroporphyrinogen decarboxylase family protein [Oceanipulchritudo sp.]
MTPRERTLACLREEPVDRIPVVHFGYWKETLLKWAREGHISDEEAEAYSDGNEVDALLCERLGFDHCWTPAAGSDNFLRPFFEGKVVRELPDGSRHVLNREGVIELDVPGRTSIRAEIEHLLVDRESWENHYKWRLQWDDSRIEGFRNWSPPAQSRPLGIWCGSLIGNVRNILGVEGLAYMGADDPELLDEIIDTIGALCLRGVEEGLQYADCFDFAHFWEDICYNHGPLVNPRFFSEKIVPWYKRMTDVLGSHGIDLVSVDCDGCIDALVPLWLEAGVNIMFPIEVGTWNASIRPWREQYGRTLKGIGGMRKHVLAGDKAAVDAEIERLKPLIALGGYIPCPDHRIPPEAKWDLVRYFTDQLRSL